MKALDRYRRHQAFLANPAKVALAKASQEVAIASYQAVKAEEKIAREKRKEVNVWYHENEVAFYTLDLYNRENRVWPAVDVKLSLAFSRNDAGVVQYVYSVCSKFDEYDKNFAKSLLKSKLNEDPENCISFVMASKEGLKREQLLSLCLMDLYTTAFRSGTEMPQKLRKLILNHLSIQCLDNTAIIR
jgi:hypothetical protein